MCWMVCFVIDGRFCAVCDVSWCMFCPNPFPFPCSLPFRDPLYNQTGLNVDSALRYYDSKHDLPHLTRLATSQVPVVSGTRAFTGEQFQGKTTAPDADSVPVIPQMQQRVLQASGSTAAEVEEARGAGVVRVDTRGASVGKGVAGTDIVDRRQLTEMQVARGKCYCG